MFNSKRIKKLEKRIKDLEFDFASIVGSEVDRREWNSADWGWNKVKNHRISLVNVVRTIWEELKTQ